MKQIEEAVKIIKLVNMQAADVWKVWHFTNTGCKLILCGYNKPFQIGGYLVFRSTKKIRLPITMNKPVFNVSSGMFDQSILPFNSIELNYLEVNISIEQKGYVVVCQELAYYQHSGQWWA